MVQTIEKTKGVWGSNSENYETLASRFRPIFKKIKEGAVHRENNRTLPFEEMKWLKDAGFGALRIPSDKGGLGATIPELFNLLIELAETDSNLAQALRLHFTFVETVLNAPNSEQKELWISRFVDGDIVGNAWSEIGHAKVGSFSTKLTRDGDDFLLNGTKYYSTGAIYADWIHVLASDEDNHNVLLVVPTTAGGIEIIDDWNGFGQKLTGSGTTIFSNTPVNKSDILPNDFILKYEAAFFQMVHLATLAGIARAAANDVTEAVAKRERVFSHGPGVRPSEDYQILQVVGQVHSLAYSAGAIVLKAAESLQRSYEINFSENDELVDQIHDEAGVEVSQAQTVVARLTLDATTLLFDALGASSTTIDKSLDRYWRNARTIASHNPLIYKERVVGDYAVNGTRPPNAWFIGNV